MSNSAKNSSRQTRVIQKLVDYLRPRLNAPISIRLWDGSVLPIGENPAPGFELSISNPGVVGTMLRSPKPETLLRLYANGQILSLIHI